VIVQNQGKDSKIFFCIDCILFSRLKVIANLWASSLIFWISLNSSLSLSSNIASLFQGRNISSSLFAREIS